MSERPLRVLQLMRTLRRGGAEVLAASLVGHHRPRIQMTIGIFDHTGVDLAPDVEAQGGRVVAFGAISHLEILATVDRVARFIDAGRFDLVHCHLPLIAVVGRLAAALAGRPVVYTEHNLFHRHHKATQVATRATWHLQEHVIAVSDEVAQSLAGFGQRPPVTVVKNGLDAERFRRSPGDRERARERLGLPKDAFVAGAVTVYRPAKRLDLWAEVAARVARAAPEARFLLVGWGPLEAEVHAAMERTGLGDRLILAGPQADVRPYLAAMDCYLMSSAHEGLPIALLEAAAMELPIVSTAVGGVPELVVPGETGALVPADDPVAGLVDAVLRLRAAPAVERATMGARGRTRVVERHGLAAMARRLEGLYDDVVRRRG